MRTLLRGTALLGLVIATVTLIGACEEWFEPVGHHYHEYSPEEPEPEPPLSVVSFGTLYHSTTAGRTVLLTIQLEPPPTQPVSIHFLGNSPPANWPLVEDGYPLSKGSVTVPAGSSRAYVPVPIPFDPTMSGETHRTYITIYPDDSYIRGYPEHHSLLIYYDPNYDPEPDTEYAKEPHPLYNKEDDRCPYTVGMSYYWEIGVEYPVMLLDSVSTAGTLCATGAHNVKQITLDRVSRASTVMLQHRPDLVERMTVEKNYGDFFLLYAESEYDWCDPPAFPEFYMNTLRECDLLRFSTPAGVYSRSIILCPAFNLSICIHEAAHAVYFALGYGDVNERKPVKRRFNEPDVAELWSGYAMQDDWEFFAEMSAAYFCVPTDATLPVKHCASELREYDPATYEVIHAIYGGSTDLRAVID